MDRRGELTVSASPPVACTLSAEQRRAAGDALLPALAARARMIEPIDAGYSLKFDDDGNVLEAILRVIDTERCCCRFLQFDLTLEPERGPITLKLTGPLGTRDFLDDLLRRS